MLTDRTVPGFLALAFLLFVTGCVTMGRRSQDYGAPRGLSREETDRARAIAHYCTALLLQKRSADEPEAAAEQLLEAARLDPSTQGLYSKAAAIYLSRGNTAEAEKALAEALEENPDDTLLVQHLGVVYESDNRTRKAEEQYRRAIRLQPGSSQPYVRLARLQFDTGRDGEALETLKRALGNCEDDDLVLVFSYNRGLRYTLSDETDRATACFRIVAEHDPDQQSYFYVELGELYEKLGRDELAADHYRMAAESDPETAVPFLRLARVYEEKDAGKAIAVLERASSVLPGDPSIFRYLGFLYAWQERFEQAIKAFEKMLGALDKVSSPERYRDSIFYLQYGAAYERTGNTDKAAEIFLECIEKYPDTHRVLNYLAYMWAEENTNLDRALEYVKRALALDPGNGAYIDTLGWIYFKQKDYEKALTQVQKANELLEDDPTIIDHLGDIYASLGNEEQAVTFWKKSYTTDPANEAVEQKLKEHGVDVTIMEEKAETPSREGTDTQ
ncbi:MAG: tetratricopeptide repeat protein [Kiritimatiellia bacterium]